MSFETLLAQLEAEGVQQQEPLAKSVPAGGEGGDDKAIQAAAGEGEGNPEDDYDEDDEDGEFDDDEGGERMVKSIQLGDEEVQVVDAEAMLKSISDLEATVGTHEGVLTKALETTLSAIKAQGAMIKSLQADIANLRGSGAGRKTTLSVHEKPAVGSSETMAKSRPGSGGQMTVEEFMAKSDAAYAANKITGLELSTIDSAHRLNQLGTLSPDLVAKVIS